MMYVLSYVHIWSHRKKNAPLFPEGTVKCTHIVAEQIHRGCKLKQIKVAPQPEQGYQSKMILSNTKFRIISSEMKISLLILN